MKFVRSVFHPRKCTGLINSFSYSPATFTIGRDCHRVVGRQLPCGLKRQRQGHSDYGGRTAAVLKSILSSGKANQVWHFAYVRARGPVITQPAACGHNTASRGLIGDAPPNLMVAVAERNGIATSRSPT